MSRARIRIRAIADNPDHARRGTTLDDELDAAVDLLAEANARAVRVQRASIFATFFAVIYMGLLLAWVGLSGR